MRHIHAYIDEARWCCGLIIIVHLINKHAFLIILLCFGDGICSSHVWILNTRDMQQPVVVFSPTLPSPLLCFADDEIVQVHTLNGI
jgi:hypothetical protein